MENNWRCDLSYNNLFIYEKLDTNRSDNDFASWVFLVCVLSSRAGLVASTSQEYAQTVCVKDDYV